MKKYILILATLFITQLAYSQVALFVPIDDIIKENRKDDFLVENKLVDTEYGTVPQIIVITEFLRMEYDFIEYLGTYRSITTRLFPKTERMLEVMKEEYTLKYEKVSDTQWTDHSRPNMISTAHIKTNKDGETYFDWTFEFKN